jgi:FkbM family methyltransferase
MKKRKKIYLTGKRVLKQVLGKDVWNYKEVTIPREFHGSEYEGWCVASNTLSPTSIVYSIGIGNDISFDLSLIRRYGVRIYAYDPTPESISWISRQNLPDKFSFFGIGLAHYDGVALFYRHKKETNICHSMAKRNDRVGDAVEVTVHRLESMCKTNHHSRIDLLKMDIEGAEYDVLEDIFQSDIPIDQILVEFHHRFKDIPIRKTKRTIAHLRENGYRIFYVSLKGREYSFLHERLLQPQ